MAKRSTPANPWAWLDLTYDDSWAWLDPDSDGRAEREHRIRDGLELIAAVLDRYGPPSKPADVLRRAELLATGATTPMHMAGVHRKCIGKALCTAMHGRALGALLRCLHGGASQCIADPGMGRTGLEPVTSGLSSRRSPS
jgi:hypothetical protein